MCKKGVEKNVSPHTWAFLGLHFFAGSKDQGPVVQSIISLMGSLVVKILTVLVSTISNSQVFLLKKCE